MTENEKLRALLAEAQKAIPQAWNGRNGKWCEEVQARIDAALAEPVAVHPSSLTDVVTLLENEREEVRAEVERLTKAGDVICRMAGNNQVINRHWKTAKNDAKQGGQP